MAIPLEAQCTHRAPLRAESRRRLGLVVGITAGVMLAEVAGGLLSGSLALLADAGHMFVDTSGITLALVVSHLAGRPATARRSYGLLRLEILAALVNGALLLAIAVGIAIEAAQRLSAPRPVDGNLLLGVAALGLAANALGAVILHRGHHTSLNQRGAYLHVMSDLLGSIGAVVAGAIVVATGSTLVDPLVSLFIAALILAGAWRLVRESADILLEATPAHISMSDVHDRIAEVPGVCSVHDLHVWTVTSGVVAMSGHLVVRDPADNQRVLETVQGRLEQMGIDHVTVQIERETTCD